MTQNEFGQVVGADLGDWTPPPWPEPAPMIGTYVVLEPIDPAAHAPALFSAFSRSPETMWTYMPFGPFRDAQDLEATLRTIQGYPDWEPYTVLVGGKPVGFLAYLRISPGDGVIEIGSISYSSVVQRTTAATEALFLMMDAAFDLGYRRCEWKCDALNEPSRSAGLRLGFQYEGTFRQATHYKGRNRDTAWFAITDDDWPRQRLRQLSPPDSR